MNSFDSKAQTANHNGTHFPSTVAEPKTQWTSIWLASVILGLVAIQFSIYFSSLWPYLSQIDPTVNQTFYGFTLAAFSFGNVIASPIFGYWNSKIKKVRVIMAVGLVFGVAGNLLYIFTEAAPNNRKWMIFVGRFLCGVAAGIVGIGRGYIATASTPADQRLAVSIGSIALSLGIAGGPLIQLILTPIGYPAYIFGPIHLNEYTAAAFVSILAAFISLILLLTVFKENYIGVDAEKNQDQFHYVPKHDTTAAILLMLAWFCSFFVLSNTDTVESPYTMANFNWTNYEAVFYNSIAMSIGTFISFILYVCFAVFRARIKERVALLVGLSMLFAFYSITFSWSFYTEHLDFKASSRSANVSSNVKFKEEVGCDVEFKWCHYTPRLPLPVYFSSYILFAIGYPMCNVTISTLFAKVLGPRRQGFMQSLMNMSGSLARMLGPILISWLFESYGPRIAWLMTSSVVGITIYSVVIGYHRLVPHKMRPELRSGQKLRYDGGTLYRL